MIEVVVTCNGLEDRAEADTPEAALLAARTLWGEAYRAYAGCFSPTVRFVVAGQAFTFAKGRKP